MSRHLTYRFWLFAALGGSGIFFALASRNSLGLAFGLPFVWALLISFVDGWWPAANIENVELSTSRAIEGDELELKVRLRASRPIHWLELELQLPSSLEAVSSLRSVKSVSAGESIECVYRMKASRWGVTGPEWLTVVSRDRLGVSELLQQVPMNARLRVHPPTEHLSSLLPLVHTRPVTGDHRSRRRGSGTELAEVRPYRHGDPIRSIHSRISARRGTPMVLDRHTDESSDVIIYVDSIQDVGADADTSLRWTVTAAMALTKRHLRSMDRVGILDRGAGVRWLPPKLGRKALHMIVDALLSTAVLQPRNTSRHSVPLNLIPRGATVLTISPLLSTVVCADLLMMRRQGLEVIVIEPTLELPSVDGLSQAGQQAPLASRVSTVIHEARKRQLVEAGIMVLPWDPSESLEPSLRRLGSSISRFRRAAA